MAHRTLKQRKQLKNSEHFDYTLWKEAIETIKYGFNLSTFRKKSTERK